MERVTSFVSFLLVPSALSIWDALLTRRLGGTAAELTGTKFDLMLSVSI